MRNTATPDTGKHMGAEEPLHFSTKTDLANHKKRKITETETGIHGNLKTGFVLDWNWKHDI